MQTAPAGFDAALAARSIETLAVSAVASTPGADIASASGWAERIVVERQMSGELPDAASDVVGGVSSTLTVDGDALAASAPSPIRDAAGWLGSSVAVSAGYGGQSVPVFAGRVSRLDASEASGALRLEGRDAADRITAPVRLRAYGSYAPDTTPWAIDRHPTNTSAIVTSILHANGIRVTPAPRSTQCELSVPGVGGWLADIGWVWPQSGSAPAVWLETGRFSVAPSATGERLRAFFKTRRLYAAAAGVMIECFAKVTAGMTAEVLRLDLSDGIGKTLALFVESGQVRAKVRKSTSDPWVTIASASIGTGWRHICAEFAQSAYVRLWVDGVRVVSATATPWPVDLIGGTGQYVDSVAWSAGGVQGVAAYWGAYTTPPPSSGDPDPVTWEPFGNPSPTPAVMTFQPEADVPAGALDLASIPAMDGKDSWAVLQDLAEAELGMVGFAESGRFFFKTRAQLAAATVPVATWGIDLVDDVRASVSLDSIITRATAVAKRAVGLMGSLFAVSASEPVQVPPGASSVVLSGDAPALAWGQKVGDLGSSVPATSSAIMTLCTGKDGSGYYTGGLVTAFVTPVGVSSWRFEFTNPTASTFWTVWPASLADSTHQAGQVMLAIRGIAYSMDSSDVVESVGDQAWGDRVYAFSDSEWRQDAASVTGFLNGMLADTAKPRAILGAVTVPADPRWQIGDPVRLTDWRGRVPGIVARITSIRLTIDRAVENGMVGTYGLRQIPGSAPRVTTQPADASVSSGSTVTFTAAASNATAYRWQTRSAAGDWVDVPGATSATYTTPALTAADSGRRYRCNALGPSGDDWTREAKVTVSAVSPSITADLADRSVAAGSPVTFTATATGDPTPTARWQVNDGTGWSDI